MYNLSEDDTKKISKLFYQFDHILKEEDFQKHEVCSLISYFFKVFDYHMLKYLMVLLINEMDERIKKGEDI